MVRCDRNLNGSLGHRCVQAASLFRIVRLLFTTRNATSKRYLLLIHRRVACGNFVFQSPFCRRLVAFTSPTQIYSEPSPTQCSVLLCLPSIARDSEFFLLLFISTPCCKQHAVQHRRTDKNKNENKACM